MENPVALCTSAVSRGTVLRFIFSLASLSELFFGLLMHLVNLPSSGTDSPIAVAPLEAAADGPAPCRK